VHRLNQGPGVFFFFWPFSNFIAHADNCEGLFWSLRGAEFYVLGSVFAERAGEWFMPCTEGVGRPCDIPYYFFFGGGGSCGHMTGVSCNSTKAVKQLSHIPLLGEFVDDEQRYASPNDAESNNTHDRLGFPTRLNNGLAPAVLVDGFDIIGQPDEQGQYGEDPEDGPERPGHAELESGGRLSQTEGQDYGNGDDGHGHGEPQVGEEGPLQRQVVSCIAARILEKQRPEEGPDEEGILGRAAPGPAQLARLDRLSKVGEVRAA